MRNLSLIVFCLSTILPVLGQNEPPGFLGNRNLFSLNASGSVRAFAGLGTYARDKYDENTSTIENTSNLLRGSINASFLRVTKRSKGFGLTYHYDVFKVGNNVDFIAGDYNFNAEGVRISQKESPEFISHTIKPNYVWTAKESFLPVGFRGVFGIGPRFLKLNTKRDYYAHSMVTENGNFNVFNSNITPINEMPEDVKVNITGIEMSYNGIIAYPISKSIMIELGFAFRTAFTLNYETTLMNNREYYFDKPLDDYQDVIEEAFYAFDYTEIVKRENWRNVFSMNFGFSYSF